MALKKVKTNRSGGKGKGRWFTREEVKAVSKKHRRAEGKRETTDW
jgi:hypothetical protein